MKNKTVKLLMAALIGGMLATGSVSTMVFAEAETEVETETELESESETEPETEEVYKKSKKMYMLDDAYVREEADADSEAVAVAKRGGEITVLGELGKWYHVKLEKKEGYVNSKYVTDKEEEAEQAVEAQEYAVAQAEAAAAAAAAAQQAQASSGSSSGSQGKHEVSRQKYDDCDGSGHGYYEIYYSDGSTAVVEY